MRRYRFCPLCGRSLERRQAAGRVRPACSCGFVDWANPVPAAGVAILREKRCLWVRRAQEPKLGGWSLPSGFQEWEEDIRECARREAREETGLHVELGGVLGVYSAFDDPRHNAVLAVFMARVAGGVERAGDDASELAWFALDGPPEPIAWDSHRRALADLRALVATEAARRFIAGLEPEPPGDAGPFNVDAPSRSD